MNNFTKVNNVYSKYFNTDDKPARSTVAVKTLPKNAKVEIEFVAFVPK
jgi:2-iminobutanoate/2-iminopropanoate deaminase